MRSDPPIPTVLLRHPPPTQTHQFAQFGYEIERDGEIDRQRAGGGGISNVPHLSCAAKGDERASGSYWQVSINSEAPHKDVLQLPAHCNALPTREPTHGTSIATHTHTQAARVHMKRRRQKYVHADTRVITRTHSVAGRDCRTRRRQQPEPK